MDRFQFSSRHNKFHSSAHTSEQWTRQFISYHFKDHFNEIVCREIVVNIFEFEFALTLLIFYELCNIIQWNRDEGKLIIYYVKPYVLPVRENLSKDLNKCNRAVILIPMDQYQRILGNSRVLKHFHCDMTNISVLQGG